MNKMRKTILIALISLAVLAAGFLSLALANSGNIVLGVKTAGVILGGKNQEEAQAILREKAANFQNQKIVFLFEGERIEITPNSLGFSINADQTIKEAAAFGKNKNPAIASINQIYSLIFGQKVPLDYSLDNKKFNEALKTILSGETPAVNARFLFNSQNQDFEIISERSGQVINRQKLTQDIFENIDRFSNSPIVLALVQDNPRITRKILESKKEEAKKLADRAPITLRAENLSWQIERQQLADWIAVEKNALGMSSLTLREDEIKDLLSSLVPAVNHEPVNAKLAWNQEKIEAFVPSQDGKKLDIEKSAREIRKEILDGKTEIYLRIDSMPAEINDETFADVRAEVF